MLKITRLLWGVVGACCLVQTVVSYAAEIQTYRFMLEHEPKNLNSVYSTDVYTDTINELLSASLVRYDEQGKLQPDLAQFWEVSEDRKTYTFELKSEAKFHDGSPVTSNDVVATWTYILDPTTESSVAKYLYSIDGAEAFHQGHATSVSGLKAIKENQVQVRLHTADGSFLHRLSTWNAFGIRPAANLELGQDRETVQEVVPISAGPYQLEQWERGSSLILVKSPHYVNAAHIAIPRIQIFFKTHPELTDKSPLELLKQGKIDHTLLSANDDAFVKQIESGELPYQLVKTPTYAIKYFGLRTDKPPLDNVNVRQAFSYAYNQQAILREDGIESYLPLSGFILPGMPGYEESDNYAYDLDKAQALLAKAGYPDLSKFPELVFATIQTQNQEKLRADRLLEKHIQALGINTKFVTYPDWPSYKKAVLAGEIDVMPLLYSLGTPNISDLFFHLFHSKGGFNGSNRYNNEVLDELIDRTQRSGNLLEEVELNRQIEAHLLEYVPVIPRFSPVELVVFSERVLNPVVSSLNGYHYVPNRSMQLIAQ